MKVEYLSHHSGSRSLILIFAGWSTQPHLYRNIRMEGWDVAVVYDYSDLSLDQSFLDRYPTIWLFAWSLGVRAAEAVLSPDRITAAYAINGTLSPVDDTCGIPQTIYNGTADNLDARNLRKFHRRMTPDMDTFRLLCDDRVPSDHEIDNLKHQLYLIRDLGATTARLPWHRAYVSDNDKIFPTANMERSWKAMGVETVCIPGAHFIPLADIVRSVIPDRSMIARRFGEAAGTYDSHAAAQRQIASHLATLLDSCHVPRQAEILEIGPGTGIFTRMYAGRIKPAKIDYVDIVPITKMGMAPSENYYCSDAENWIEGVVDRYDCILSASTIQWFTNIPGFLRNCRDALRPGGILLISGFLSGTLGELDPLRPSPIHYHPIDSYKGWMKSCFRNSEVFSEEICLEFSSPRELLMHLKHTGVGGSAPSPGLTPHTLRSLRRLTYRPVYLIATK